MRRVSNRGKIEEWKGKKSMIRSRKNEEHRFICVIVFLSDWVITDLTKHSLIGG